MQKIKENWLIILVAIILLGSWFYWYEWRPSEIRKECAAYSFSIGSDAIEDREFAYSMCLSELGLKR